MPLFHLVQRDDWEGARRQTHYRPPSLEREGFIHLSTELQWRATARRFFLGQDDLLLLTLDEDRLEGEVRYELADGDRFPHLYGPLNVDAVASVGPVAVGDDGTISLGPT